MGKKNH